jgi:hypothetical protein
MMTARKTKEKRVGDCNKPIGLILEWKMMIDATFMFRILTSVNIKKQFTMMEISYFINFHLISKV